MLTQRRYGGMQPASTVARQTFLDMLVGAAALQVARAWTELRRRHQQRKAIRELTGLTDRLLDDIGLSRADIAFAARTGRSNRLERAYRVSETGRNRAP